MHCTAAAAAAASCTFKDRYDVAYCVWVAIVNKRHAAQFVLPEWATVSCTRQMHVHALRQPSCHSTLASDGIITDVTAIITVLEVSRPQWRQILHHNWQGQAAVTGSPPHTYGSRPPWGGNVVVCRPGCVRAFAKTVNTGLWTTWSMQMLAQHKHTVPEGLSQMLPVKPQAH